VGADPLSRYWSAAMPEEITDLLGNWMRDLPSWAKVLIVLALCWVTSMIMVRALVGDDPNSCIL